MDDFGFRIAAFIVDIVCVGDFDALDTDVCRPLGLGAGMAGFDAALPADRLTLFPLAGGGQTGLDSVRAGGLCGIVRACGFVGLPANGRMAGRKIILKRIVRIGGEAQE